MANSVLPIHKGFEFQAKYFWYKACALYREGSNAVEITYEADGVKGFDDITLSFDPPKVSRTGGYPVSKECYQVKFHVDHSRAFDFIALTDPSFIGASAQSLLQKLHTNFKTSPEEFKCTNYYILNTWGIDRSDALNEIVNNDGCIIFKRLFDNTTDNSKMGKIRKLWREHLGIDDLELETVLRQLRIRAHADSGELFDEHLSNALCAVRLKPLYDDKRTSPYDSLIIKLHAEGKNKLQKADLEDILKQEDLWVKTSTLDNIFTTLGIRTFRRGAENLESETDHMLCLLEHFNNRFIIDELLWESTIQPEVSNFAKKVLESPLPITLHLDTHGTIAFAFGYFIGDKSGKEISLIQKNPKGGRSIWQPDEVIASVSENQWLFSEELVDSEAVDLAVTISLSNDIANQASQYISNQAIGVSNILHAIPVNGVGFNSVRDANHIIAYIEQLKTKIRSWKSENNITAKLHFFISAPNSFTFFLGMHSSGFGRICLYEYDFEGLKNGTYAPSINLPI